MRKALVQNVSNIFIGKKPILIFFHGTGEEASIKAFENNTKQSHLKQHIQKLENDEKILMYRNQMSNLDSGIFIVK